MERGGGSRRSGRAHLKGGLAVAGMRTFCPSGSSNPFRGRKGSRLGNVVRAPDPAQRHSRGDLMRVTPAYAGLDIPTTQKVRFLSEKSSVLRSELLSGREKRT